MTPTINESLEQSIQSELFRKIGNICAAVNVVTSTHQLLEVSLRQIMALFGAPTAHENDPELALRAAL